MVTYIINFFTSEENKGAYIALQSSKCSIEDIFNLKSATIIQYTIKGRFMSR